MTDRLKMDLKQEKKYDFSVKIIKIFNDWFFTYTSNNVNSVKNG